MSMGLCGLELNENSVEVEKEVVNTHYFSGTYSIVNDSSVIDLTLINDNKFKGELEYTVAWECAR